MSSELNHLQNHWRSVLSFQEFKGHDGLKRAKGCTLVLIIDFAPLKMALTVFDII